MTSFRQWAERHGERFIPEAEYAKASAARREALADAIRASGLSYSHIAAATRVGRKAVSRAANGIEIRQETADRIQYYIRLVSPRKGVQTGEILPDGSARLQTIETK